MGALARWIEAHADEVIAACCPDPDPSEYDPEKLELPLTSFDALDYADPFEDEGEPCAITSHGYNPDTTPVDTLMAGPVSMHLHYAEGIRY